MILCNPLRAHTFYGFIIQMNSKFAPILILILVILLAGVMAYFVLPNRTIHSTASNYNGEIISSSSTLVQSSSSISNLDISSWQTLTDYSGPAAEFQFKAPPTWSELAELRFPCNDPVRDSPYGAWSPLVYDAPGYEKSGAYYLVQFCLSDSGPTVIYNGFVKVPIPWQQPLDNSNKISLTQQQLEGTAEYPVAQKILSTARVIELERLQTSPQGIPGTSTQAEMDNTFKNYCQTRQQLVSVKPPPNNTDYSDVLVIENTNSSSSVAIGDYFASKRNIPAANIVHIKTSIDEEINDAEFQDLRAQIESYISANNLENKIDYIVTTKGVPLKVARESGLDAGLESSPSAETGQVTSASVDSELALIFSPLSWAIGEAGPVDSPYYFDNYQNMAHFSRAKYGIYLVTRLDGYTVPEVEKIIDEANTPIPFSSSTKFVFDEGPLKYGLNGEMTTIANALQGCGFNVVLDATSSYLTNQQDVVGYVSFGSNDPTAASTTINADPHNIWHAGAIAETFVSGSARTFTWPPQYGQSLIADLIAEGVTGAEGYTYEPYTSAMPNLTTLFTAYTSGYNLAESFYADSPYLSWMGVVIGDPKTTIEIAD